ncbi:hypothetical protein BDV95DRAFT_6817 [Massariosphaeria phaeospora]|uniref:Uncharacterized protein n=1 Tax=Massariosphaeria phaeospora TaxID=100035 RepID=A0A7C8IQX7_9PLEO|nr:hypothetical protein BDV95DRAFT_6817 [Massariosphaeria phaeospora]
MVNTTRQLKPLQTHHAKPYCRSSFPLVLAPVPPPTKPTRPPCLALSPHSSPAQRRPRLNSPDNWYQHLTGTVQPHPHRYASAPQIQPRISPSPKGKSASNAAVSNPGFSSCPRVPTHPQQPYPSIAPCP